MYIRRNRPKPIKKPIFDEPEDTLQDDEDLYENEAKDLKQEIKEKFRDEPLSAKQNNNFITADFNNRLLLLTEYIKQAPIKEANQKKMLKELSDTRMGDDAKLDNILKQAENMAAEGNILLKTLSSILEEAQNSNILDDTDRDAIIKYLEKSGNMYRDNSANLEQTIKSIKENLSEYIEAGKLSSENYTMLEESLKTGNMLQTYNMGELDRVVLAQENALAQEVSDNAAQMQKILRNTDTDKTLSQLTKKDIQNLLDSKDKRVTKKDKKLLSNIMSVINDKDKLLPTTIQTLTEEFEALNNDNINKMLASDNLNNRELLKAIQELQAVTADQNQRLVLDRISDTLSSIETLQENSQLSKADEIRNKVEQAQINTKLENIGEYLENMSDSDRNAKKMFSGTASSLEEAGEEAGDYLWDLVSDSKLGRSTKGKIEGFKRAGRGKLGKIANAVKNSKVVAGGTSAMSAGGTSAMSAALKTGGSALKSVASKAGVIGSVASAGIGAYNYLSADDSAERKEAVGEGIGGTIGSIAGGALGTLIPIPGVGTAVGAAVGGWLGSKIGSWFSSKVTDPEDYIPDDIKKDPNAELAYIDNTLIPNMIANPSKFNIDDDDKQEALESIQKYRDKVAKKANIKVEPQKAYVIDNLVDNTYMESSSYDNDTPDLVRDIVTDSRNGVKSSNSRNYIEANRSIDNVKGLTNVSGETAPVIINNNYNTNTIVGSQGVYDPMTQALR